MAEKKTKTTKKSTAKKSTAKKTGTKEKPKKFASKSSGNKSTKAKTSKSKAKKKVKEEPLGDMGIVIVDDDLTIDQEKINEERRAYLEEARSQEASD